MDTHEYNKSKSPHVDGANINNNSEENDLTNSIGELMIATPALLRGMDLGRNIRDEHGFDEPDDSTYPLSENNSYYEVYNKEQLADYDTTTDTPTEKCGDKPLLPVVVDLERLFGHPCTDQEMGKLQKSKAQWSHKLHEFRSKGLHDAHQIHC